MKYLVDTDWVIDFLKGRVTVVEELTRLSAEGLAISLITYGEIYEGIYFSREPRASEHGFFTVPARRQGLATQQTHPQTVCPFAWGIAACGKLDWRS